MKPRCAYLQTQAALLASEAQEALLTQYGGHEVVLLMNSIERAMGMGSAASRGVRNHEQARRKAVLSSRSSRRGGLVEHTVD